ncbi:PH domain-containing protein [Sinomonas cellulolyticus]|uniref:PH domain-containing protein n=1 Tax=Sinomonas cellulolyticus TaxID=2801916 RepID=A0ABS1K5P6_9MICC|nr:PH domain-containing protein [Sinomonas cellulolyticus]
MPRAALPSPALHAIDPVGVRWRRLAPRYVRLRLVREGISTLAWTALALIPWGAAAVRMVALPGWLTLGLPVAVFAWGLAQLALTPRRVRAMGYAEREDDLLIRRGLLMRRVSVVPYGRMQYVDVSVGPLEGALGLATVKLHTAAAATRAEIPGLPETEAARLRDQLSARGEARLAGL